MTDFSRYLIASDLDGTFFGPGATMVERNLKALERFRAGGGLFTYSSGRLHYVLKSIVGDSRLLVNAPTVLCNGAYLYDFHAQRALEEEWMNERDAKDLLNFTRENFPHIQYRIATASTLRVQETDRYLGKDLLYYDAEAVEVDPTCNWRYDDWYKIVYRDEGDVLADMRRHIEKEFGNRLGITATARDILEIQNPDCNKAKGLDKLRRHCGADRILIACGDFENDIEMLAAADIPTCPENAMPAVKAISKHILCHCRDGAIADLIEKLEGGEL